MAASMVRVICPNLKCRTLLCAPAHARGKLVKCSACGMKVRIPAISAKPAPSDSTVVDEGKASA